MTRSKFVFFVLLLINCVSLDSFAQTDSTFTPSGRMTAQLFLDYYYKTHKGEYTFGISQYASIAKDFSNFEIRRVFLGYNYDFSRDYTGEILLSYEGNLDNSENRTFLVKAANLRWRNIYHNADLVVGLQFTPSFVLVTEKVWGYRSVEKSILDKSRLAVPTDLGIGLQGVFDDDKNYGYNILYANGSATKLELDRYKKVYGDLWAKFLDKTIIIDLYADLNQTREVPKVDFVTLKFFAGYQTEPLTVGIEMFIQKQNKGVLAGDEFVSHYTDAEPLGISAFIRGEIIPKNLHFFARYDMFDPDVLYNPDLYYYTKSYSTAKEHFVVAGLDYAPLPNVHVMPNIWYSKYWNKMKKAEGTSLTDHDLVPRVTFSFKY